MKNNLTEVIFILDRSGSMGGLELDTIGGFNSLLKKQKEEEGRVLISTVLFDDISEVIHDRIDISRVTPMTERDYYVRGCTALLDAIGDSIHHIGTIHKYARKEDRPDKTLFIITTDGMENSSKRYSYTDIKRMIERQKERYKWEFLFLGANMDAISEAERIGIETNRAVRYECDDIGTRKNYRVLDKFISTFRLKSLEDESDFFDEGWKEEIEIDYCTRHRSKGR